MRIAAALLLAITVFGAAAPALSCDCPPPTVREALKNANAIFIFVVLSASEIQKGDSDATPELVGGERIKGVILKVWKGPKVRGDSVEFRTPRSGPGTCWQNTTNEPRWFAQDPKPDRGSLLDKSPLLTLKPDLSKWLVAAYGNEPYSLGLCTISSPLLWALDTIEELDRLVPKRNRPKGKFDLDQHEP
jgi:hypothetical protein